MKTILFPSKLNRYILYESIIPEIYNSVLTKEYGFIFDMRDTELSDAESLISVLAVCSIIRNKYNHITKLELPESMSFLRYLENTNFFSVSEIFGNKVLDFVKYTSPIEHGDRKKKRYKSIISNINNNSLLSSHQTNVSKITYDLLQTALGDKFNSSISEDYKLFELSFLQIVFNFFEHNMYDNPYKCSAYYMGQYLPYGKIQIVFYDTGKGFRKRIIEMIDNDNLKKENGEEYNPEIEKYREIEDDLRKKELWFSKAENNSNYQAIKAALNYREGSIIPGLSVIKEFTLNQNGSLHIHSANVLYDCFSDGTERYKVFDNNFSGVHLTLEFPI